MSAAADGAPFCAAVDWGTSSFRLWLLGPDGASLAERRSDEGMMQCATTGFAPVLARHLGAVRAPVDLPVVICGMAGARQGWCEAPYVTTPATLADLPGRAVVVPETQSDIRILPGIAQRDAQAPDVMRGEETQLVGIADRLGDGLVCLPGTHCKWVALEAGTVRGFSTYMTGELFALLCQHSILAHAIDEPRFADDSPAFRHALVKALADPAAAPGFLFQLRAGQLLGFEERRDGAARLSGLLIGAEIAAARARHGASHPVTLVASGVLASLYGAALATAGYAVTLVDAEQAVRNGLFQAARLIWSGKDIR
jgi:2-dehydro-3-deoxygalactonokinase